MERNEILGKERGARRGARGGRWRIEESEREGEGGREREKGEGEA